VVWDLATPSADEHELAAGLTDEQAKKLWDDLAGDAEGAGRAIRVLAAAPIPAVQLLQAKLRPIAKLDPEQVKKLIVQLESDQFSERERAAKELEKQAEAVSAACRQALDGDPSPELRRRLEKLLAQLWSPSPEQLRAL